MHYYLYEIRNNINRKIYVGVHKTKVLDDGYMGSGLIITRAIEKHGVENFTKTILEIFETQEEMFAREKEIVNEEFLSREDTYNLRRGGLGGFDHLNDGSDLHIERTKFGRLMTNEVLCEKYGDDYQKVVSSLGGHANILKNGTNKKFIDAGRTSFLGKSHTPEFIKFMSDHMKEKQSGDKNSQFGSMWITNGIENKKIKKIDFIPEGWYKGRKLKKSK